MHQFCLIFPVVCDVSNADPMCSPSCYKMLLSALGLLHGKRIPQRLECSNRDPLGEGLYKVDIKVEGSGLAHMLASAENDSTGIYKISPASRNLKDQVFDLNTTEEILAALDRIVNGIQTLTSRLVLLTVLARLSSQEPTNFLSNLRSLDLLSIQSLCRLLRLVHAGRIGGMPCDSLHISTSSLQHHSAMALDSLSDAIAALIMDERTSAADDLMRNCSRDLFTAAVGGAKLSERWMGLDSPYGDKSDLAVMCSPNFEVSQRLVQILAKSASKLAVFSCGLMWVADGLAACLFSSKLQNSHKLWALEQLVKILAATHNVTTSTNSTVTVVCGDHSQSSQPPGTYTIMESVPC